VLPDETFVSSKDGQRNRVGALMPLSLLARFPKLRAPTESWPVIPEDSRGGFLELSSDFALLDREVAPPFTRAGQGSAT
jgi:hypothetical protein